MNNNPVKRSPDDLAVPKVTSGSTRDFLAVAVLFLGNGLVVGTFGGSLPGLRSLLDLGPGQIVGVLVAAGIFAVASMNLSGPLSDRFGARVPSMVGGGTMTAAGVVMGLAPNYPVLVLGAALFGLGNGAMDVSMNTLGVSVEQARRRPVMSRLHACFSIGGFVGALVVVVLGRLLSDDVTKWSLWTGSALMLVLLVGVYPITPQSPRRRSEDGASGEIPKVAWLLAAMAVCFGLTEGTAVDWSSLHVTDVGNVSPSTGAWGLACVSGFMVVIRLCGDYVVERLGRPFVVRTGSACALVGYLFTVFGSGLAVILVGWCLVGLGVGLVAPQIYGLAGHVGGGRGLAVVVSFGYAAFLIGPAIIGFVVSHSDLQRAMLVPVVTAVGLIVMSARLPADPTESPTESTADAA
ncbi:MFS transporter [Marmoricola sp. URHB0036]|uniref:MFS transporter n=1 Tax=Marmoricola sp. URHB0036 TaxID=1298863 RepID=UPI000420EDE5|nr:MFS transporter [Marmoricola sp. URHB0036]